MTQHPEQPDTGHQPVRQTGRPGRYHTLAAGIGIAAAMILCCAGPILIAAGALGAIAGFFSNPLVLLAAATVLLAPDASSRQLRYARVYLVAAQRFLDAWVTLAMCDRGEGYPAAS